MLKLKNITKIFPGKIAVDNLSLEIKQGEVFGFLGPNGAGKTTTVKMILALLKPSKGEITIFNKANYEIEIKQKIGFLPENTLFYKYLTGFEFLCFVGEIFGLDKIKRKKRAQKLIKKVGLSEKDSHRAIREYSKGMQQRIGLAQALINNPKLLFLDEPMSGLDPIGRKEVKDLILELKKEGKTIFFNSHILTDAEALCDRVGIINKGKLIACDKVKNLVKGKKSLEDVFIELITGKKQTGKKTTKRKVVKKA